MFGQISLPFPLMLFDREEEKEIDQDQEKVPHKRKLLVCNSCATPITFEEARIEERGSHEHHFFNPHGIVYEIGCFNMAPGCRVVGESSSEFSWFPGYLWQVGCCVSCQNHLGWRFFTADSQGFHGLILDRLAPGEGN